MDVKGIPLIVVLVALCITSSIQQQDETCIGKLDLVFLVDASNSVLEKNFERQMYSLATLTNKLTIQPDATRIGVVVFSSTVISTPVSGNIFNIQNALGNFEYLDESTRTDLGLIEALNLFRSATQRGPEVPKLLMVITDGASTEPDETLKAVAQLKAENISIYAVGISDAISENELKQLATSPSQVMLTPDFNNITSVLVDAVFQACKEIVPSTPIPTTTPAPVFNHLCSNSGSNSGAVGLVNHPSDCDKYVQCYYNPRLQMHLGVVRQCPFGLFYDDANMQCDEPANVNCPNDRCKTDCDPYPVTGTTRGYFACNGNVSQAMCCDPFQSFVRGKGCVNNSMCMEHCKVGKCGKSMMCTKRPNWDVPSMFGGQMPGRLGYYPGTCDYNNFDIITCKCSSPVDHTCNPDFETSFTSAATLGEYVKTTGILGFSGFGGVDIGPGRKLHIDLHKMMRNEPLTLKLQYRENFAAGQDNEILLQSNNECKMMSSRLMISYNSVEISAFVLNNHGKHSEMTKVSVPAYGFSTNDVKELTFSYDNEYMVLTVKVGNAEYVEKIKAPSGLLFPCGLDIGPTSTHSGFNGRIEKLSIYSCTMKKLYQD